MASNEASSGQVSKPDLVGLANDLTGGDMDELARLINESLIKVSSDLTRLSASNNCLDMEAERELSHDECDYIITPNIVFHRLEHINIQKRLDQITFQTGFFETSLLR